MRNVPPGIQTIPGNGGAPCGSIGLVSFAAIGLCPASTASPPVQKMHARSGGGYAEPARDGFRNRIARDEQRTEHSAT